MKRFRGLVPLIVSAVLLVTIGAYTPWGQVGGILHDFDLGTIGVLVALSLVYYGLKALRFWYMLQAMNIVQPLPKVALSYMSAQPVTLLPAGEIYRSRALEQHTGVPLRESLPQFTMQGLFEGAAMAAVGLISALAVGTLRLPVLLFTLVVGVTLILIRGGRVVGAIKLLNRLPFVNVKRSYILQFSNLHQAMLSRRWLPRLFGLSLATELVGATIAYTAVVGLGGHISGFQAVLVYIIPVVISFVSLLPGGLGAGEQSAIAVLLLCHVSIAHAVASTLIMRVTIVGLGVVYGGIAWIVARYKLPRPGAGGGRRT